MKTVQERVAAAAEQRENALRYRNRIWRWCRRHPWLMLMAALIAAPFAYDAWRLYGWRPDVVVKGQIVDYDTGQPVEGAWVLIYIWADGRIFDSNGKLIWYVPEGGSTSMTSPMSTAVQTDNEGRFHYRVSAYDAYQFASYTMYGIRMGVYKQGYESVSSDTGKSQRGAQGYLPFDDRGPYRDWPSLKRVGDSLEQRRLSRDDFSWTEVNRLPVSDATWPQWARFLHAAASDEINHWCDAPATGEEDRSYTSFYTATALITEQERMFQAKQLAIHDPDRKISGNYDSPSFRALQEARRLASPDYPWPLPYENHPSQSRDLQDLPVAPAFSIAQQGVLCSVMRQQSDNILKQSLNIRNIRSPL